MSAWKPALTEEVLQQELARHDPSGPLRFGQAMANQYLERGHSDPEVYYCADPHQAFLLLQARIRGRNASGS